MDVGQQRPSDRTPPPAAGVSVLVLTYNEEQCIASCINSIAWSNDIVVLDSFSTDRTVEILAGYPGLRVFQRQFDNFSDQRNYGLHEITFENEWVLIVDADETCPGELRDEILAATADETSGVSAFRLRRRVFFLGSHLAHNSHYDVWLDRLVRPREVRYHGALHEKPAYQGRSRRLTCALNHYPFGKGISRWIQRRNVYSSLAAQSEAMGMPPLSVRAAVSDDPIQRRQWLNAVYRRLPCRWLVFFLYNFFVKLCFLDGAKGMYMVLLESYYELTIVVKVKELELR